MFITITSRRQVAFPAHVLDALGAKPGDQLELQPSSNGFLLRAKRVNASRLAPLRGKVDRGRSSLRHPHLPRADAGPGDARLTPSSWCG